MASRGRHGSMNFVAMRRVRRCGLRVAFVAHTQEFRCSAVRTPLWATHCLRRIRMPKNFVCIAVLHPTAQDLRCLAMQDFFSIGLLVSYRFMFFFIDWKLPPPACPGTTGIMIYELVLEAAVVGDPFPPLHFF